MVPLLTLGLPPSAPLAVLLSALMLHGVRPGPLFFQQHASVAWALIASMYIGNVMLLVLNLPLVGMWVKILDIPLYLLVLFIILFSFLGVYTVNNSVQDLVLMVGFGVFGYILRRLDIPAAPIILAMVLGDLMEQALRQTLVISDGSLGIFVSRPIAFTLLLLAAISITNPYWKYLGMFGRRLFARQAA